MGGSLENRTRFAREILARSRRYVGTDYPILVKLSLYDLKRTGDRSRRRDTYGRGAGRGGF
jgi:2,4-dienoyl-CoA reductase-like NADH-dependent reductase (Old Yellow Enzyme family)